MCKHLLKAGLIFSALLVSITLPSSAQLQDNGSEPYGSAPFFNGTTYILFEHEMKVVLPVNGSQANLTLFDEAEDMALLDDSGSNVSFNSSYQFHRGDHIYSCLLYTSDAADDLLCVDLGGRRIIKKKNTTSDPFTRLTLSTQYYLST